MFAPWTKTTSPTIAIFETCFASCSANNTFSTTTCTTGRSWSSIDRTALRHNLKTESTAK